MNALAEGDRAPDVCARSLAGQTLGETRGPLLLLFGRPEVHASRLVVGFLRRLKERLPELPVLFVLQGSEEAVRAYSRDYLDESQVIHDGTLELSRLFAVSHVPTLYYLEDHLNDAEDAEEAGRTVRLAFTGFSRDGLNRLARLAAAATGGKAQELVTAADNKGEYELAERGLTGEVG